MCGLSGFIGLNCDKQTRQMLVLGLADGIDNRGGHACGYVSVDKKGDLRYARKRGVWVRSRLRFIDGAASDICVMHARFATCGNRDDANNAHPFAIRRNGRVVLWGAHNGMIPTAWDSAKKNERNIQVDSQEIFELLADKDYEGIQSMSGYGVITWIDTDARDRVNLARLSSHSDIILVSIKGGGYVWASTKKILTDALNFADLEAQDEYDLSDIGRVYQITEDNVYKTHIDGIRVETWTKHRGKHGDDNKSSQKLDVPVPADKKSFKEETTYSYSNYGSHGLWSGYD